MNRIQIGPLATAVETHPETRTKLRTEPARQPREFQPSLFVPLHYEKNYAYPLIVWLHSNGDDQSQVLRIMPTLSLRNFVSVAPQASDGNNPCGFFWEQTVHGIEHAQAAVKDAINYAQIKLNIASHRIFLAGYGAGGTMAFRVGLQLSQILAGVISINGPLPNGMTPLRDWMTCRKVPVFWAHCRKSQVFNEKLLCDQLKLLHVAGFNVTLRQYPNGDELPAHSLTDLNRWVMESIETAIV